MSYSRVLPSKLVNEKALARERVSQALPVINIEHTARLKAANPDEAQVQFPLTEGACECFCLR